MRSAEPFQTFGGIDRIVFDKTGTLTRGEPRLVDAAPVPGVDRDELVRLAAAVEVWSEHPLARAVVAAADEAGLDLGEARDFEAVPGHGVRATVEGRRVVIGRPEDFGELADLVATWQRAARTVMVVTADGAMLGALAVADPIEPDAAETVAGLRGRGIEPVLITGDNSATARAVADRVGIEEVHASVLPGDKAERVRELQRQGHRVAMVGDGINDAPALTQADIGIAIGAGTDIAIESADVILVSHRLRAVLDAYEVGRGSYRRTKQNLVIAFAFNGLGVPAAVTGMVYPVWAMAAMAASVTLVLLNSFGPRLFTAAGWRLPDPRHHDTEADSQLIGA